MLRRGRRYAIVACAAVLGLSLPLAIVLLLPDRHSLSALQKMIEETGSCRVSAKGINFVIQADTARIENDTLILQTSATTSDNAWVVVSANACSASAGTVSVRFITSPKDMLELTFHHLQPTGTLLYGTGTLCMKLDRHWTLRQWLQRFRRKLRTTFK